MSAVLFPVELRVRSMRRSGEIEFNKRIGLPFVPFAFLMLHEGPVGRNPGLQIQEVAWSISDGAFVCQMMDDIDREVSFADNEEALISSYTARGWEVRRRPQQPQLYEEHA